MFDLDFNNQHAVLTFPQELLTEDFVQDFLERVLKVVKGLKNVKYCTFY
jgi:hypothetical protein